VGPKVFRSGAVPRTGRDRELSAAAPALMPEFRAGVEVCLIFKTASFQCALGLRKAWHNKIGFGRDKITREMSGRLNQTRGFAVCCVSLDLLVRVVGIG
jgi:hypothetical protein